MGPFLEYSGLGTKGCLCLFIDDLSIWWVRGPLRDSWAGLLGNSLDPSRVEIMLVYRSRLVGALVYFSPSFSPLFQGLGVYGPKIRTIFVRYFLFRRRRRVVPTIEVILVGDKR